MGILEGKPEEYDCTRVRVCRKRCLIVGTYKAKSYRAQATKYLPWKRLVPIISRSLSFIRGKTRRILTKGKPTSRRRTTTWLPAIINNLKGMFSLLILHVSPRSAPPFVADSHLRITSGDNDILRKIG